MGMARTAQEQGKAFRASPSLLLLLKVLLGQVVKGFSVL